MNILITGASGFVGSHIIKSLLKSHHQIIACVHKTKLSVPLASFQIDFNHMLEASDWLKYLKDIDVVINCVGIIAEDGERKFNNMHYLAPVALFKACEQCKVKKVIQISAIGASVDAEVEFLTSKGLADAYLSHSRLNYYVLRPSLVYGKGGSSYQMFKKLSDLFITPLVAQGDQLIQPIHIDTLVAVVEKCIQVEKARLLMDVVTARAISYKQWMLQLRSKNSAARFIHIPMFLLRFMVRLLEPLKLDLISTDNLTMLSANILGDST
ncbi:MAG TPA: NAD-dependent epimerase/dehydratase family protein, partial [Oceanospirillales bacterium]|nr:NAD-dependent epimerase/dehydratase family protein [Oceanospirillales bacterium]